MTKDEALKLALEALEEHHYGVAQIIIREALAQPAQGPQIAFNPEVVGYVAPQRTWVGLTEKEVEDYWDWEDFQCGAGRGTILEMVRDIEAKLKEKNT